ncbi:MAG: hypothetical protein PF693_17090 [Spirochaetia bacterium]|jgi:type I restriction enzyme S subunit|nr:hypothetical protein [Spirochaetia bacterium]
MLEHTIFDNRLKDFCLVGDVVFGIIGSIGIPYVLKKVDKFGLSSSVAILGPNKNLDSKYLYYYMTSNPFQMAVEAY